MMNWIVRRMSRSAQLRLLMCILLDQVYDGTNSDKTCEFTVTRSYRPNAVAGWYIMYDNEVEEEPASPGDDDLLAELKNVLKGEDEDIAEATEKTSTTIDLQIIKDDIKNGDIK